MNNEDTDMKFNLNKLAHIVSDVFSPLMMPVYATALTLWYTMLRYLPLSVKLWALGGVFVITTLAPLIVIFTLMRLGKVSDMSISDRGQRPVPYIVSILCYVSCGWFLHSMQAPVWLSGFFYGAAIVSILSLAITNWWKISAHAGAVGGVAGAIYYLSYYSLLAFPMQWLTLSFAIVGAVAWARLYLNHHTPMQVLAGAAMAFVVEILTISML